MTELAIAHLLGGGSVDPGAHLDAERLAQYAQSGERLAPVDVFKTPEGLLLVDGYHRLAAAQQRGATTIEAEVRSGSRHDALAYAAEAAAAQRRITPHQAEDAIRRHAGARPPRWR